MKLSKNDIAWTKLFILENIYNHNFTREPYYISSKTINKYRQSRNMCYITKRKDIPKPFKERNLFILPIKNGKYVIFRGEGFCNYTYPKQDAIIIEYKIPFHLDCLNIGDSEGQHLNMTYNTGILDKIAGEKLYLGISGRKFSNEFNFSINKTDIEAKGVQYEIDGNFEGENKILIIEAKNDKSNCFNIRQLFYPYRILKQETKKKIVCLFLKKKGDEYIFWEYEFTDDMDYNSLSLKQTYQYKLKFIN